ELGHHRQIHLGADLLQTRRRPEKPAAAAQRRICAEAADGWDRAIQQRVGIVSAVLRQTFQYSIASVASAVIGLLSAICFTRLLSPEQYGVYIIGLSTAGIVSAVLFTWVR